MARFLEDYKPKKKKKKEAQQKSPSVVKRVEKKANNSTFMGGGSSVKKVEEKAKTTRTVTPRKTSPSPTPSRTTMTDAQYQKTYGHPRKESTSSSKSNAGKRLGQSITAEERLNQKMYGDKNGPTKREHVSLAERDAARRKAASAEKTAKKSTFMGGGAPVKHVEDPESAIKDRPGVVRAAVRALDEIPGSAKGMIDEGARRANKKHEVFGVEVGLDEKERAEKKLKEIGAADDEDNVRKLSQQGREMSKDLRKEQEEIYNKMLDRDKLYAKAVGEVSKPKKVLYGAAESMAGMAADKTVGTAAGTLFPGAGQAAALASMFVRSSFRPMMEARREGATDDEALKYGTAIGGAEALSELVFSAPGMAGKVYGGLIGKSVGGDLLGNVGGKITRSATKNIKSKALKDIVAKMLRLGGANFEEGTEETITWALDPAIKEDIYGKNVRERTKAELGENMPKANSPEEAQAILAQLTTKSNIDAFVDELVDSGMKKSEAEKYAKAYKDYYIAYYSGDEDEVDKAGEKIAEMIHGRKSYDLNELAESWAVTTVITGVTGAPAVHTTSKIGSTFRDKNGLQAVKAAADRLENYSSGANAKMARQMKEDIDNGIEPSGTAVYQLLTKQAEATKQLNRKSDAAQGVRQRQITEKNLITPEIRSNVMGQETVSYGAATQEVTAAVAGKAKTAIEAYNNEHAEDEKQIDKDSAARATMSAVAYEIGTMDADDIDVLRNTNEAEREIFKRTTGVDLDQYNVTDKNGKVDIEASNAAMADALLAKSTENYVTMAEAETELWKDTARGETVTRATSHMESGGSAAFQEILDGVDEMDHSAYVNAVTTAEYAYQEGRNIGLDWSEAEEAMKVMFPGADITKLQKMYEAGVADRKALSDTARDKQVMIEEAISDLDTKTVAPLRGNVLNETGRVIGGKDLKGWTDIAQAFNIDIHLVKGLKGHGAYRNGEIFLNVGESFDDNIGYIYMHEMTHHLKKYAPEQYQALADRAREDWFREDSEGMRTRLDEVKATWKKQFNQDLTDEDALEEIIANSAHEFLKDKDFVDRMSKEDPSVPEAILNAIRDILRKLRSIFANTDAKDTLRYDTLFSKIGELQDYETLWLNAYVQAYKNKAAVGMVKWENEAYKYKNSLKGSAIEGTDAEYNGSARNGLVIKDGNARWTEERMSTLSPTVTVREEGSEANAYAVLMSPRDFLKLTLPDESLAYWNKRSKAGDSKLMRSLDIEDLRSSDTPYLMIDSTENGEGEELLDIDNYYTVTRHNGRHRMRALMEAGVKSVPVLIYDKGKSLQTDGELDFTLSPQWSMDGSGPANIGDNYDIDVSGVTPVSDYFDNHDDFVAKFGGAAQVRFSAVTTEQDAEYMQAVESGDMETAQRLVNEAAKAAGYTEELYHGTKSDFTSFDINKSRYGNSGYGIYLGAEWRAAEYGKSIYDEDRILHVYAKTDNLASGDDHKISAKTFTSAISKLDIDPKKTYKKYGGTAAEYVRDRNTSDFRIARDLQEWAKSPEYYGKHKTKTKSTSEILSILQDTLGYDGVIREYDETVLWDNTLVKLADPVTYDDNGNVIPLSERFNTSNSDIRWSAVSGADAIGLELSKENHKIKLKDKRTGKSVDKVTRTAVIDSPLGALLKDSVSRGILPKSIIDPKSSARDGVKFMADFYSMLLKTNDPDLVYAISGTIGYDPTGTRVGESISYEEIAEKGTKYPPIKSNSEPQYGTSFDLATICIKTQAVIDAMSEAMKRRKGGLTKEEVIDIVYKEVYEAGEPVPCPVCFVFARWVGLGSVLDTVWRLQNKYPAGMDMRDIERRLNELNGKVDELIAASEAEGKKIRGNDVRVKYYKELIRRHEELEQIEFYSNLDEKYKAQLSEQYEFTDELKAEKKRVEDELEILDDWSYLMNTRMSETFKEIPSDVLFDINAGREFAEEYPDTWRFRTSRGPGLGKAALPYSPAVLGNTIMGILSGGNANAKTAKGNPTRLSQDIQNINKNEFLKSTDGELTSRAKGLVTKVRKKVQAQNLMNGQRVHTNNDWRHEYATDYMLAYIELSAIGSKAQEYSKVLESVWFQAACGVELNLSVMPKGSGLQKNKRLDNGKYLGIDYNIENSSLIVKGKDGKTREVKWENGKMPNMLELRRAGNEIVDVKWGEIETDDEYSLVFSDVTGAHIYDALMLAHEFDNVQPILVATSPEHFRLAAKNPYITMFIPNHNSGNTDERYFSMMDTVGEPVEERTNFARHENEHEIKDATEEQRIARDIRTKILKGEYAKKVNKKETFVGPTEEEKRVLKLESNKTLRQLLIRFYGKDEDGNDAKPDARFVENFDENGNDADCYGVKLDSKQASVIMPFEYWDKTSTVTGDAEKGIESADDQAKRYIAYVDSIGYHPVFAGWDADGKYDESMDFTSDAGYWGSLIDRCMYNNDGTYHKQRPLSVDNVDVGTLDPNWSRGMMFKPSQPNDPEKTDAIADRINEKVDAKRAEDAKREEQERIDKEIDKRKKWLKNEGLYMEPEEVRATISGDDLKFSAVEEPETDADGNELSQEQTDYFKNSKARKNGKLVPVYHTTSNGGFTMFDPAFSKDNRSLFFSDSLAVSQTYARDAGQPIDLSKADRMPFKSIHDFSAYAAEHFEDWDPDKSFFENTSYEKSDEGDTARVPNPETGEVETVSGKNTYEVMQAINELFGRTGSSQPGYYQVYLNLENPLVLEAGGYNWNNIEPLNPYGEDVSKIHVERTADGFVVDGTEYTEEEYADFVEGDLGSDMATMAFIEEGESQDFYTVDGAVLDPYGFREDLYEGIDMDEVPIGGTTREWAEYAQNEGHDGVIIREVRDIGGASSLRPEAGAISDIYIAFSPEQVKDVRNKDPHNVPDIRYSAVEDDESDEALAQKHADDDSWMAVDDYETLIGENETVFVDASEEKFEEVMESKYGKKQEKIDEFYAGLAYMSDGVVLEDPTLEEGRIRLAKSKYDFMTSTKAAWRESWLTDGKILDIASIKKDTKALVESVMQGSNTKAKYRSDIVNKTVIDIRLAYYFAKQGRIELADEILWHSAHRMIDNVEFYVDDGNFDTYKSLRDYMKTARISLGPEYWSDTDFGAFRRRTRGRINLVRGETNIDKIYDDLYDIAPEWFNEEAFEKNGLKPDAAPDILLQMEEVLDKLQPYAEAYSSEYCADWAVDISTDLLSIMQNGKELQSLADRYKSKYEQKVDRYKSKYEQKVKDMKARHAEAMLKVREEAKAEGIQQERREWEIKEQKAEKRAQHKTRFDRISDNYDWLAKRVLDPTKDKYIPEEFRKALADVLACFDLQTKRSKKLQEKHGPSQKTLKMYALKARLEELSQNKDGENLFEFDDYIPYLLDSLAKKVDGKTVDAMNEHDLADLDKILAAIKHNFIRYNKIRVDNKRVETAEMAGKVVGSLLDRINARGAKKHLTGARWGLDTINMITLTPVYFFERLGSMKTMYDELRYTGFDTYVRNQKMIQDEMQKILGKYYKQRKIRKDKPVPGSEIDSWRDARSAVTLNLQHGTVTMTVAQRMSLYELGKRLQAKGHLSVGGISVTPIEAGGWLAQKKQNLLGVKRTNDRVSKITEDDLNIIAESLTDEQIAVADALQKFMATKMADLGNEAHREQYGYEIFGEENYFPMRVLGGSVASDPNNMQQTYEKIKSWGSAKPLVPHATNPLEIDDIFSVTAKHCDEMALYNAYLVPISDFMRVYNSRVTLDNGDTTYVKDAIERAFGKGAISYINNFISDINGIKSGKTDGATRILNGALGRVKKVAVAGNIRVAAQQPTAITRAWAVVPAKYFTPIKDVHLADMDIYDEMWKYCPIAQWKNWGYYDTYMSRSIEDVMFNNFERESLITRSYGVLDNMTWSAIWQAVKAEQADLHKGMDTSSEEFLQICGRRASEVFDKTQVVDSTFHRSDAMRSDQIAVKMMSAFQSEPTLTWNVLRSGWTKAVDEWTAGDKAKAVGAFNETMLVLGVQAAAVSFAQAAIDAWRGKDPGLPWGDDDDDDDDADYIARLGHNFISDLIDNVHFERNIFLVRDIEPLFNAIMSKPAEFHNWPTWLKTLMGWDVENYYGESNIIWQYGSNIYNGISQIYKKLEKGDDYDKEWYDIIQKLATGLGPLMFGGVPAGTWMRDLKPIRDKYFPEVFATTGSDALLDKAVNLYNSAPWAIKDTSDLIKQNLIEEGYSKEEAQKMADEWAKEHEGGLDKTAENYRPDWLNNYISKREQKKAEKEKAKKEKEALEKKLQDYREGLSDSLSDEQKDELVKKYEKNLAAEEKKAAKSNRDESTLLYDAYAATAGLEGEALTEKAWGSVSTGYKDHIARGDYGYIDKMRKAYEEVGGDTEYFDEQVKKASVTEFKKTILFDATEEDEERQAKIYSYLLDHGYDEKTISSELIYKSDEAKEMKAAFRTGNKDLMLEALVPLAKAGIQIEDLDRLWENRNRYQNYNGRYKEYLKSTGTYGWPVNGTITSGFGYRSAASTNGVGSTNHQGLDIGASMGTEVHAADGGQVIFAGWDGTETTGFGKCIRIRHDDGTITEYAHLSWWDVHEGDTVAKGAYIGNVGSTGSSTGPHLHFGVMKNDKYVDPLKYLKG